MNNMPESQNDEQEGSHWLTVSDLMAGLMMVFLFIALALMRDAFSERDKIKKIAVAYKENQVAIYQALVTEFSKDLERWNADIIEETLTFTFKSPDVLFETGETILNQKYKALLLDFFPRYIEVLEPFRLSVSEVRIEGHTSSVWKGAVNAQEAYFNNMALSQGRTRSVLDFIYNIEKTVQSRPWIKSNFAAVGLSSSKLIYRQDPDGHQVEDRARSRRVGFRVITNSDIQIKRILSGD